MSDLSDYLEEEWLKTISEGSSFSASATYVALFTSMPDEDGTGGTEVSGGSYSRAEVNQDGATQPYWNSPTPEGSAHRIDNNGDIEFAQATADWGTVVGVGLYDASTGGNLLAKKTLDNQQTVNNGSTFKFADGDLDFDLD